VLTEVVAGPEDVPLAIAANPEWVDDHLKLAMQFVKARDLPRAAAEYEKLSLLASLPDAALLAAVCRLASREPARAESLVAAVRDRTGAGEDSVRAMMANLIATMPLGGR
jgi:hypothetical protein